MADEKKEETHSGVIDELRKLKIISVIAHLIGTYDKCDKCDNRAGHTNCCGKSCSTCCDTCACFMYPQHLKKLTDVATEHYNSLGMGIFDPRVLSDAIEKAILNKCQCVDEKSKPCILRVEPFGYPTSQYKLIRVDMECIAKRI
jgi:hypothetical protein